MGDAEWTDQPALSDALYGNAPNPFNPETVIRFALAEEEMVRLEVFDVVGPQMRTLMAGWLTAGEHQVKWDRCDDSGGLVSSVISAACAHRPRSAIPNSAA
ncbi:MAG: hypothetical protein ABIG68_12555 [Acidobacteriota bacterium]